MIWSPKKTLASLLLSLLPGVAQVNGRRVVTAKELNSAQPIIGGADGGEGDHTPEKPFRNVRKRFIFIGSGGGDANGGHDLDEGAHFSPDARLQIAEGGEQEGDGRKAQYPEITGKDDDHDPDRDGAAAGEADVDAGEKKFICNGVEVLAELRFAAEAAGET